MVRVGNLGGISKDDGAAGTHGGADRCWDACFLLDCLPQGLYADVGDQGQCGLHRWVDPT